VKGSDKNYNLVYKNWFLTRFSWPRAVFISSVSNSAIAVYEASRLDVPCLAISDTDVKTQAINVAIPANDKSEAGALYYNKIVSDFVVLCKLNNVLL
jgi:ribosomal protein S2